MLTYSCHHPYVIPFFANLLSSYLHQMYMIMRCTLSFDKKCFRCGAIFLNSVTGWNWTIFWSWTRVCFDASLFLPETTVREPLHLGTRARCTSCPARSDFRSKCIRRSPFFRRNCIPSLNLIEMHGSEGLTSVHWSTRCSVLRNPSDGIAATWASP